MKKRFIAAAFAAVSALPAANASGARFADAPQAEIDTARVHVLEGIEVRGVRAGSKTPVAYSNVEKGQLSAINDGQDIPFLLTITPSVVATSDAGTGIGYTGVRIRGVDATRINVTSNGIPLNDAESHSLYWVNMPDLASSIEDIQVQRGVGTSTNGAGAFGGSINLRTESPAASPSAEIGVSAGSFGTHRETVKANTGLIGGRWAFGMRLSNIRSDGYIDRASADMRSWFAQGGYYGSGTAVKLVAFGGREKTYHAWDGVTAEEMERFGRTYNPCGAIYEVVRDAAGIPLLGSDGGVKVNKNTGKYYANQHDNYAQNHYQLVVNQRISAGLNLNATLHYTSGKGYYEEYKNGRTLTEYGLSPFLTAEPGKADYMKTDGGVYVTDSNGNYTVTKSDLVRRKEMENGFGGGIFSLQYDGGRLTATLGGGWNRYAGDHFGRVIWIKNYIGILEAPHEYYRNSSVKDDGTIFLRANYEIAPGLDAYADLQYRGIRHRIEGANDNWDWLDGQMQRLDVDKTYNFFNPKAGLFYSVDEFHSVYASFAAAHKEPTRNNFTDARFGSSPRPERLFDYEAGYHFRGRYFSAGVNLYYMDYKDQLVLTGETNDIGEPLSDNVAKSYRAGIELTAGVRLTGWLRWDINATFSRNRIKDYTEYLDDYDENWEPLWTQTANRIGETAIAYSPSVIAGSFVTARFGKFGASLQSQYVGSQYVTNSQRGELRLDAYFVNNLRLDYTFAVSGMREVEIGLAVYNIFNERYSSNGWGYSTLVHGADGTAKRYDGMYYFPQAGTNFLVNLALRF